MILRMRKEEGELKLVNASSEAYETFDMRGFTEMLPIEKAYLERVTVAGVTFRYDARGVPQGLCRARRLTYVATAGGPISGENLGFAYVEALLRRAEEAIAEGLSERAD